MRQVFVPLLVFLSTISTQQLAWGDEPADSKLRALMGEAVFEDAGLQKLTAKEMTALLNWLSPEKTASLDAVGSSESAIQETEKSIREPLVTASPVEKPRAASSVIASKSGVSASERFGEEQLNKAPEPDVPDAISARLIGEFRGWQGKTVFKLDNGQIWQQRVGGKYRSPRRQNPEVRIERGRFGYYLRLAESGRSVGVKRVR